ncbi:LA2681 family HEPN domain-containing protein [Nitrosomonas oligotropha]|uniref:LA2681 family HEPN domain-containing protein n=1 Tax=Nitrosomonas oligotropha TaxID=42354 RepID=UPI000D30E64F|nr:LA2681 family HEPN domain-containing protein [Nitrosomonas oligotropha]
MRSWLEHLSSVANWNEFEFKPKEESRGKSRLERYYRTWCIEKRLFLNPLNDIWEKDIVANDVLTFPSIVTPVTDRKLMFPEVYGVYNQLKQEFVSTRYILFEAISESENKLHFSDERVKLYDMLDFRKYRLWIEKLKMAFLSAYAIFDKIAYLINEHWGLSINVEKVSFRTVWYELGGGKRQISKKFHNSENWPLRGLYWLSKDLFFRANDYFSIEPDARHLNHIRNHITHKYLRVYDDLYVDAKLSRENDGHQLSYPIGHEELKLQSIKLLKLVRSALIYLSLAAHAEESRAKQKIDKGLIAAMNLCEIKDTYRL